MRDQDSVRMNPTQVLTPVGRASYAWIIKPQRQTDSKGKEYDMWSVSLIFPPDADLTELKKLAQEAALKKWGSNPPSGLNNPLLKGDDKGKPKAGSNGLFEGSTGKEWKPDPDYAGRIYINAKSRKPPQIGEMINNKYVQITDPEKIYSGMWIRCSVTTYSYDNAGNVGVGFGLGNIIKIRDDERLDGRTTGEQDFEGLGLGNSESVSNSQSNAPSDEGGTSLFD